MKKVVLLIGISISASTFASPLRINASAQGSETCKRSVEIFTDLIVGHGNPTVEIEAKKLVIGACDGDSCNPDSQKFKVSFRESGTARTLNIATTGPDSSNRCLLERR